MLLAAGCLKLISSALLSPVSCGSQVAEKPSKVLGSQRAAAPSRKLL